jgi:tetratricopeptide (TPR) repeat protein
MGLNPPLGGAPVTACRLLLVALVGLVVQAGCRLPWSDGPISHRLAASRDFCQQGVAAMEQGDWEKAKQLLEQAVHACPDDVESRRHYAEVLWRLGEQQKAITELQEVMRIGGANAEIHVRLAEMWLAMNDRTEARRHAEAAIGMEPGLAAAWVARARISLAQNDNQAALDDYHHALGLAPDDRDTRLAVAEVYHRMNQPQRALSMLQRLADAYTPGEEPQQVLYLEGLAYAALGRHDEAVDALSLACQHGPGIAEIYYQLARSQFMAGHLAPAAEALGQALALEPRHQASRDLLSQIEVALRTDGSTRR